MASEDKKKPRIFMTSAYVKVLEKGLYGLFRNINIEDTDERTGKVKKEKLREVGPIAMFREARSGEEKLVVMKTFHPTEKREISLVETD